MSMGRFHPFCPTVNEIALAEDDRLRLGSGMVNWTVVALLVLPLVPLIVNGYVPGIVLLPAVTVSRTGLAAFTTGQFNAAVTPAGIPDTTRFTFELLNATALTIPMVELTPAPPCKVVSELGEAEMAKLGGGIVTAMVAVLVSFPATPVTTTL
jgi:hypothetical protein